MPLRAPLARARTVEARPRAATPPRPVSAPSLQRSPVDTLARARLLGHGPVQIQGRIDGAAAPVQRLMSKGDFQASTGRYYNLVKWWKQDQVFTDLDKMLGEFAGIRGRNDQQTVVHQKMAVLDRIERRVNAWFDANKANLDNGADYTVLNAMRSLLDSVQREHIRLTQATVEHGHELWLPEGTSKRATRIAQSAWQTLVANNGNIQIHDQTREELVGGADPVPGFDAAAFRGKNLSSLARLLTGQKGRLLIRKLLHGQHQVDIHPMHPAEYLNNPGNVITLHESGDAFAQSETQGRAGSGSSMRMDPTTTDSQSGDLDAAGNRILAPNYTTLGHELIHALHNAQGMNRANVNSTTFTNAGGAPVWKNMEELATIAGLGEQDEITENSLREEHGLTKRRGHEGGKNWKTSIKVYSFWAGKLDPIGHVFVEVTTPDRRMVAGFSPNNIPQGSSSKPRRSSGEAALIRGVPGRVAPEPESVQRTNLTSREFKVTPMQAQAALNKIDQDMGADLTYRTFGLNCATWAVDVLRAAGQSLPLSWFSGRTPVTMWSTSLSQEARAT